MCRSQNKKIRRNPRNLVRQGVRPLVPFPQLCYIIMYRKGGSTMSNIEKINDYQTLTDEQFAEKYNQTKAEFLKEWESENKKD